MYIIVKLFPFNSIISLIDEWGPFWEGGQSWYRPSYYSPPSSLWSSFALLLENDSKLIINQHCVLYRKKSILPTIHTYIVFFNNKPMHFFIKKRRGGGDVDEEWGRGWWKGYRYMLDTSYSIDHRSGLDDFSVGCIGQEDEVRAVAWETVMIAI